MPPISQKPKKQYYHGDTRELILPPFERQVVLNGTNMSIT